MSAVNSFATALANLILNNQAITGIGDAGGLLPSASDGNLYLALFTTDPGETGDVTNECAYTSYARVAIARDNSEWTVTNGVAQNVNTITFPNATGGSETATHWGLMSAISGDNMIIGGELSSPIIISADVQAQIPANELIITFD
jgi:hypothetical protein